MGIGRRPLRAAVAVTLAGAVVAGSVGPADASPAPAGAREADTATATARDADRGSFQALVGQLLEQLRRLRPPRPGGEIDVDLPHDPTTCDPLDAGHCILPFPSDHFTVDDTGTDTGRRVSFAPDATPANALGHIDPTEVNRNDGFSPGSALAVLLPDVDLEASGVAPITDMAASLRRDAPIVIIEAKTGRRHAYWAELDVNAPTDEERLTFVRPAENFREGERYIVGIRNVVDGDGDPIEPSDAFRAYRDRLRTGNEALEARRSHMEGLFRSLGRARVARDDLVLAWDFTVASERNLSERVLAMRDDAFDQLGDDAPDFTVTSVTPGPSAALRQVQGTFEVPTYLTGDSGPGSVLANGEGPESSPIPERTGTLTARFACTIPASATDPDGTVQPTRSSLYGHGLLGAGTEALAVGSVFHSVSNTTFCGTWWIGMSQDDLPIVFEILQDLSEFRTLPDRLQQSYVNFLFLGRLMLHPEGFSSDPAFQADDGTPLLDQENLVFVGNSQGGILGGGLSAVAQDWARSFLGVPAMNFSTLLDRSVNWDVFAAVFDPTFDNFVDRQLSLLLAQMLWDRGEGNGHAQHLTRQPYRDTPAKRVMIFEAFGDHQVANVATEVLARTIGARVRTPALAAGRSPDVEPFWGIDPVRRLPGSRSLRAPVFHPRDARGSFLVPWDFGTPAPPTENVPNRAGQDPHGMGTGNPDVMEMARAFLEEGRLVEVCGGGPCQTLP